MLTRAIILAVCMFLTGAACILSPEIRSGEASGVVMTLPDTLPNFISEKGEPDAVEKKLLPDDTEFAKAHYFTPTHDLAARDVVHLSIILSGAERKSIHRPEVCLVGQGWTLLGHKIRSVALTDGRELKVTDLYIEKALQLKDGRTRNIRAHYMYWFVGTDLTTPSHAERIWLTLRDNLFRNMNHRWAYASVMSLVTDGFDSDDTGQRARSDEETLRVMDNVIKETVPAFQREFMNSAVPASS